MPKMEARVYLTCNMRSSGCTQSEERSISVSTKDSRSPPPAFSPRAARRRRRDVTRRDGSSAFPLLITCSQLNTDREGRVIPTIKVEIV